MPEGAVDVTKVTNKILAVVGGCAVVAMGALGIEAGQASTGEQTLHARNADMTMGVTVTQSVPPSAPVISMAVPAITGPATLPPEDQGLPG